MRRVGYLFLVLSVAACGKRGSSSTPTGARADAAAAVAAPVDASRPADASRPVDARPVDARPVDGGALVVDLNNVELAVPLPALSADGATLALPTHFHQPGETHDGVRFVALGEETGDDLDLHLHWAATAGPDPDEPPSPREGDRLEQAEIAKANERLKTGAFRPLTVAEVMLDNIPKLPAARPALIAQGAADVDGLRGDIKITGLPESDIDGRQLRYELAFSQRGAAVAQLARDVGSEEVGPYDVQLVVVRGPRPFVYAKLPEWNRENVGAEWVAVSLTPVPASAPVR